MKVDYIHCDKCEILIDVQTFIEQGGSRLTIEHGAIPFYKDNTDSFNFCSNCTVKLLDWINNKQVIMTKSQERDLMNLLDCKIHIETNKRCSQQFEEFNKKLGDLQKALQKDFQNQQDCEPTDRHTE